MAQRRGGNQQRQALPSIGWYREAAEGGLYKGVKQRHSEAVKGQVWRPSIGPNPSPEVGQDGKRPSSPKKIKTNCSLAKLQATTIDAVGPLTSLLKLGEKGELTPENDSDHEAGPQVSRKCLGADVPRKAKACHHRDEQQIDNIWQKKATSMQMQHPRYSRTTSLSRQRKERTNYGA